MKNLKYIFILLFLTFYASSLFAQDKPVRLWLKIFSKRNQIEIKNSDGFYFNGDSSNIKYSIILKKNNNLLLSNEDTYQNIVIFPKNINSTTNIVTKYGKKQYKGHFNISIKDKSFFIINHTALKDYLYGVVGSEMGESFSIEALKAQAIASRSYFYSRKFSNRQYDIWDINGSAQAFRGLQFVGTKVQKAVDETTGLILQSNDSSFIPYFHSTCGGKILDESGYLNKRKTLIIKEDFTDGKANCSISPYYRWKAEIQKSKLIIILSKYYKIQATKIEFSLDSNSYLRKVKITHGSKKKSISGIKFKQILEKSGYPYFRSINCDIYENKTSYVFEGNGFGHFLGMCQWGAEGLARKGYNFKFILNFYYPKAYIVEK